MIRALVALLALALAACGALWAHARSEGLEAQAARQEAAEASKALSLERRARAADLAALELEAVGRDRVQVIVREVAREIEREPTADACLRDPAILRAYDAISRMRDAAGPGADPAP